MPQALHTLYRFFDLSYALLYVGVTNDPGRRLAQHRGEKSWWDEVAFVEMEPFSSRPRLLRAERNAIVAECPRYNVRHARPVPLTVDRSEPGVESWHWTMEVTMGPCTDPQAEAATTGVLHFLDRSRATYGAEASLSPCRRHGPMVRQENRPYLGQATT